jgi:hypothetical protein
LCDFEKRTFARSIETNSEKKPLKENLIGLKFNMEDQEAIAMEAHSTIIAMEQEVKLICNEIVNLKRKYILS